MSFEEAISQRLLIQGQEVRVDITLKDFSSKNIKYEFVSSEDMHPMTVGLAMLCIAETIFVDHGHDLLEALGVRKTERYFDSKIN